MIDMYTINLEDLREEGGRSVDMVNLPPHYTDGDVECIDAIRSALGEAGFVAYCRGQIIKYTWRMGKKGAPAEDAAKAEWYAKVLKGAAGG